MPVDSMRRLLTVQRKRLVASVLGFAERELWDDLTAAQRQGFRDKFISAVDAYHDLMLDILGSTDDATVLVNVEAMELLRDIRANMASGEN